MNHLIIYTHPYSKSYNSSILRCLEEALEKKKQPVDIMDLYKENFNPVLDENELAVYSQGKFLDKVLLKNWAYEISQSGLPKGKLGFIKKATVITTMKSPKWYYRLMYKNSIKHSFINGTLKFCGIKNIQWVNITGIERMGDRKRKKWLKRINACV